VPLNSSIGKEMTVGDNVELADVMKRSRVWECRWVGNKTCWVKFAWSRSDKNCMALESARVTMSLLSHWTVLCITQKYLLWQFIDIPTIMSYVRFRSAIVTHSTAWHSTEFKKNNLRLAYRNSLMTTMRSNLGQQFTSCSVTTQQQPVITSIHSHTH